MNFYKTRVHQLKKNIVLNDIACPACGSVGTLRGNILSEYIRFASVPFLPLKKHIVFKCSHCHSVFDKSEDLQGRAEEELKKSKHAYWMYTGSVVFMLLIAIVAWEWNAAKRSSRLLLAAPAKGDRYEIKTPSGHYTLMRVSHFTADSVWFFMNRYESNRLPEIIKMDVDSNYSHGVMGYSTENLREMEAKNNLLKITRP